VTANSRPAWIFSKDDKNSHRRRTGRSRVQRIEAGMPVVSPSDTGGYQGNREAQSGPENFRLLALHGGRPSSAPWIAA